MDSKKLVRSVIVFPLNSDQRGDIFEVGKDDCVAITFDDLVVQVFFRAEDEKVENSTPRRMEDRPMKSFNGFPFIITDTLQ